MHTLNAIEIKRLRARRWNAAVIIGCGVLVTCAVAAALAKLWVQIHFILKFW